MLQNANVSSRFVTRLTDTVERGHDLAVSFAGIRLAGDGMFQTETHRFSHHAIELFYLAVITIEQCQKSCLSPRGALDASESQRRKPVFNFFQIQQQIPAPSRGAFSDGCRLSGLKVSKTQARQVAVLRSKCRQLVDDLNQAATDQIQTFLDLNQFRVVSDEAAGSS